MKCIISIIIIRWDSWRRRRRRPKMSCTLLCSKYVSKVFKFDEASLYVFTSIGGDVWGFCASCLIDAGHQWWTTRRVFVKMGYKKNGERTAERGLELTPHLHTHCPDRWRINKYITSNPEQWIFCNPLFCIINVCVNMSEMKIIRKELKQIWHTHT